MSRSENEYTVIVLNSAVFINRALDFIKENGYIRSVDYFRDRDDTGEQSIKVTWSNGLEQSS